MDSEQSQSTFRHPPQPMTVADVYARMKSQEEADRVLKAHRLSEAGKSVAGGVVGGAVVPLLMSVPPALSGLGSETVQREAVKHKLQQSIESAYAKANVEPGLASHTAKDLVGRLLGPKATAADLAEFNHVLSVAQGLGVHVPLPSDIDPSLLDVLKVYGRSLKVPLTYAAVPAALGGIMGMHQYNKRLGERKKLLSEVEKVKTSTELPMNINVVSNAAFWAEVENIEKAQGLQKAAFVGTIVGAATAPKDRRREGAWKGLLHGDIVGNLGGSVAGGVLAGLLAKKLLKPTQASDILGSAARKDVFDSATGKMVADRIPKEKLEIAEHLAELIDRGKHTAASAGGSILGGTMGSVGGGVLAGRSLHKKKEAADKANDLRLEILHAAFADELTKLGHEKTAIWGAIRKMFGSGADNALQGIAQRGAASEAARFGAPKQVIGPAGSGQPLGRSAAEVQKILAQRRVGGMQEAVNQKALSATPAQRQSMIRARAGTEVLSPGGRVDFGNNSVTFPSR